MTDILLLTWARAIEQARAGWRLELALLVRGCEIPKRHRAEVAGLLERPPRARRGRVTRKFTDVQAAHLRDLVRALTSKQPWTVDELDDPQSPMTKAERASMRKLLQRLPLSNEEIAAGLDISVETLRDVVKGRHSYAVGSNSRTNSPNKQRK